MNVKYRLTLTTSERVQLVSLVLGGKGAFRRLKRAQILLAADKGATDQEIAKNVAVGTSTVSFKAYQAIRAAGFKSAPLAGGEDAGALRAA